VCGGVSVSVVVWVDVCGVGVFGLSDCCVVVMW